jgi:TolB-like protein
LRHFKKSPYNDNNIFLGKLQSRIKNNNFETEMKQLKNFKFDLPLGKIIIVLLVVFQVLLGKEFYLSAEPVKYQIASENQSEKILAVADFTNDTGDPAMDYLKKGLANSLVTSLAATSNNNFSIVERGQFESIIKEMGLASTGVIDISTATKIGSALGATQVIVGGIIKIGTTYRLNVRVIEVKTSRVLLAFTEYTKSEGEILQLLDKVADKIVISLSLPVQQAIIPSEQPADLAGKTPANPAEQKVDEGIPLWVWITGGVVLTGLATVIIISGSTSHTTPYYPDPAPYYPYYPALSVHTSGIGTISSDSFQFEFKF